MGKDIGRIYKHSQSQLSTLSFKAPVHSYSASQVSLFIKLTTTSALLLKTKTRTILSCVPKIPSVMIKHHK